MNTMFRPQNLPKRYTIRGRLQTGRTQNFNFVNRVRWYPAGWKANHQVLGKIHSRLHYLACHAPEPIQRTWRSKCKMFVDCHFGHAGRASMRYLNRWSCHSWL